MTDYEILIAYGESAFKAAEIVLDAKRGHDYALLWIRIARRSIKGAA
jgi:hypothetical protein